MLTKTHNIGSFTFIVTRKRKKPSVKAFNLLFTGRLTFIQKIPSFKRKKKLYFPFKNVCG